jgi:hypothetical protein
MKRSKIKVRGAEGLRLETKALSLEVGTDFGPRVTAFASKAKGAAGNLLLELPDTETAPNGYRFLGGHRLWHSPEHLERTYQHDHLPLAVKPLPRGAALAQAPEEATGMQKAVKLEFVSENTLRVTHALTNLGLWPVETACWALTMFRPGGYGVLPLLPKGSHKRGDLLPGYSLVPWTYTDLSLDGWDLHRDYYGIDVNAFTEPQKLGITDYPGWSAYYLNGSTFVKHAALTPGAVYPDRGCPFETFTNGKMLELETLGALTRLEPGQSIEHVEHWTIFDDLPEPATDGAYARLAAAVGRWVKTL